MFSPIWIVWSHVIYSLILPSKEYYYGWLCTCAYGLKSIRCVFWQPPPNGWINTSGRRHRHMFFFWSTRHVCSWGSSLDLLQKIIYTIFFELLKFKICTSNSMFILNCSQNTNFEPDLGSWIHHYQDQCLWFISC